MARPSRFFLAGHPQHVIQRGNNRARVFFSEADRSFYLKCLDEACTRYGCDVHSYVLMTNHVHLLVSPASEGSLPRTMQAVGRRYAQFINWRRERTGTLWEGRYRATLVNTDTYFLVCSRYIELNPVRANLAAGPGDYAWSSFRANACGGYDILVKPHALYLSLGTTRSARCAAYRALFEAPIEHAVLDAIRAATQQGWPLGDSAFREAIGLASGQRANPLPKGGSRAGSGRRTGRRSTCRSPEINRL